MIKIVICGGHITPALAVIDEIAKIKDIEILFFGRKYATEGFKNPSWEYKIISGKKIKFYSIIAGRLQRKFTKHTLLSLLKIPVGFIQSFFYLIKTRPAVIVSFGGYLSCPIVFGAWLLGIKSLTHEQSVMPGLANKINSLFVEKIYLSWKQTQKYFPENKTLVIGNPVRLDIFKTQTTNKKVEDFFQSNAKIIYVTGGNQGSHILNSLVFNSLQIFADFGLIHQVGSTNYKGDLDKAKTIKSNKYLAVDFLNSQTIGAILNRADIVISRSGANTVWELAALAKPSILVPLAIAAGNEQYYNAQVLQEAGSSLLIEQKNLTPQILKKSLTNLGKNLKYYKKKAEDFQKTIPKDAAQKFTIEILRYT